MPKSSRQLEGEISQVVSDTKDRIDRWVTKYMDILGVAQARPVVGLHKNLGATWLGRSTWDPRNPHTTLLELQQSVVRDDRTLERVIAHEMIHHRDAIAPSKEDAALRRAGIRPPAHGDSFRQGAARINAVMGPDFVTEKSDQTFVQAPSQQTFYVLITPLPRGKLGWTWAARLGDKARAWIAELTARGGRLVQTTDERWTRGAKIVRHGGYSMPRSEADAALLRQLYDAAAP